MLISYNWLRELTDTKLSPQELRERLTNVGLAVDAVEEGDGDYVLDVEVPSNRGDCLSHVGIARELATIELSRISDLRSEIRNSQGKTSDFASVEIRDPDLCPRYAARIVRGVKIAPSPEWLRKQLEVLGQRPAKLLGLHTEASHRFERSTDPEGVLQAQERCVALICEIVGGVATKDALDVYPIRKDEKIVSLHPERVEAITSLNVSTAEMVRILRSLGFDLSDEASAKLTFTVPSWRHDVAIEEDLIEEVARHTGFDRIGTELSPSSLSGEYH